MKRKTSVWEFAPPHDAFCQCASCRRARPSSVDVVSIEEGKGADHSASTGRVCPGLFPNRSSQEERAYYEDKKRKGLIR